MTLLPPGFLHDFPSCPFRSTGTYLIPSAPQNSDSSPTRTFKKCKTIPKYYLSGKREDAERAGRVEVAPEEGWSPEEAAVSITVRGEAGGVGRRPANPASNCHSPSPAREDPGEEDRRSQGKAGEKSAKDAKGRARSPAQLEGRHTAHPAWPRSLARPLSFSSSRSFLLLPLVLLLLLLLRSPPPQLICQLLAPPLTGARRFPRRVLFPPLLGWRWGAEEGGPSNSSSPPGPGRREGGACWGSLQVRGHGGSCGDSDRLGLD